MFSPVKLQLGAQQSPLPSASLHVAALSQNSRRAYDAQWRQWVTYATHAGVSPVPAAPATVAQWLLSRTTVAEVSIDGRHEMSTRASRATQASRRQSTDAVHDAFAPRPPALATLRSAISAVRLAHLAHGLAFDSRHPDLALALKAAKHDAGPRRPTRRSQVEPLRVDMLRDILATLSRSPRDCRDAALLALGYCFARRRSELTGLDLARVGEGSGCLRLTPRTLELHLVQSKRNDGSPEVYVVPRAGNQTAVRAITTWLDRARVRPGEPVLRRVFRSGKISKARLDPQSVALIVKHRVEDLFVTRGMSDAVAAREAAHYAGHSLRVGFAVTAAEAGASVLAIQNALGHAGPVMAARYAQAAERDRMSPHRLDGVSLGKASPRKRKSAA